METMQITLAQALAPEIKAPEVERSDEFSSILSGKEVVSQAESPPGQSPPPAEKQAVEEAEIQEPNAQSQKPDFHCKTEAPTSQKTDDTDVEAGDDANAGDGTKAQAADAVQASTPQLLAQAALTWVASIPATVAEAQTPLAPAGQAVEVDPIPVQAAAQATDAQIDPSSLLAGSQATDAKAIAETPIAQAQKVQVDPSKAQLPVDQKVASTTKQTVAADTNAVSIAELPVEGDAKIEVLATVPAQEPAAKSLSDQAPIQNAKVQASISSDDQTVAKADTSEETKANKGQAEPAQGNAATDVSTPEIETAKKTKAEPVIAEAKTEACEKPVAESKTAANDSVKPEAKTVQTETKAPQAPTAPVQAETAETVPANAAPVNEEASKAASSEGKSSVEKPAAADKVSADEKLTEKKAVANKTESVHKADPATNGETAFEGQEQDSEGKNAQTGTTKTDVAQFAADKTQSHNQNFKIATEVAPASKEQAPLTSAKTNEVIRQIVDRVESIAARHQDGVVIRLDPQDLGTITMTVKSIGDQVEAHIVASDDRVRTALDTTRSQLAQAIESKGFNLKSVTVTETTSTQTQADLANQNRSQSQQQTKQDQQALRQQSNMWSYAYGAKDSAAPQGGFRRATQTGLDLWT